MIGVVFKENETFFLVNTDLQGVNEIVGDDYPYHFTFEHENMNIGAFTRSLSSNSETVAKHNVSASHIFSFLKQTLTFIKGPIVLYNNDKDIDLEFAAALLEKSRELLLSKTLV